MTEFTPDLQAKFTNQMLYEFATNLDRVLRDRLRSIAGKVPNVTLSLLRFEIMEANADDISAHYELFFQDSGRISEMKKINPGKVLPSDVILDWIKRGRQGLFRKTPGYTQQPGKLSEAKKMERIAYAIARTKSKGTRRSGKKKIERQWINKSFYGFYNRLVTEFITKQAEFLQGAIAQGFEGAQKIEI